MRFFHPLKPAKIKGFGESDETTIFFLTECRALLLSARSSPQQVRGAAPGSIRTGRGSFVGRQDEQQQSRLLV